MTKPDTRPTDYQLFRLDRFSRVRCDNCLVSVPKDRIVWRGPDGKLAICDECQEAGDDYR